jgi:hypothetical protein
MRNVTQFASPLTRWIYYASSPEKYLADIDACLFRMKDQCLRIVEWKRPMERLSPGQRRIFPLLDSLLVAAEEQRVIRLESGLYIVRGLPPFADGAEIGQPWPPRSRRATVDQEQLIAFVDMERISIEWRPAKW